MAERWTVSCLRDFLYLELGKAIEHGNAPRQCRLCGHWFLHKQGDKSVYCGRVTPGETEKTCREVGRVPSLKTRSGNCVKLSAKNSAESFTK